MSTPRRRWSRCLIVPLAFAALLVGPSRALAVLLAYEGFDYTVGSNLVGLGSADAQWGGGVGC